MSIILSKSRSDPKIPQLGKYAIRRITSSQSHEYDITEKIVKLLAKNPRQAIGLLNMPIAIFPHLD
jgi:hypothetical protein